MQNSAFRPVGADRGTEESGGNSYRRRPEEGSGATRLLQASASRPLDWTVDGTVTM